MTCSIWPPLQYAAYISEDVVAWLDDAEIRYIPRVKLSGRTGYDHHYDFVIPKSASHPERVLLSINNPNRANAERTVFAWEDTKRRATWRLPRLRHTQRFSVRPRAVCA